MDLVLRRQRPQVGGAFSSSEWIWSKPFAAFPAPRLNAPLTTNFSLTFLNKTHPNTSPDACAECGKPETPDETLLPFGLGARHAWLHSNCWGPWRAQRRVRAEDDLARLGVVRPTVGAGAQGQCPTRTLHAHRDAFEALCGMPHIGGG
jgi:hypothetical protein